MHIHLLVYCHHKGGECMLLDLWLRMRLAEGLRDGWRIVCVCVCVCVYVVRVASILKNNQKTFESRGLNSWCAVTHAHVRRAWINAWTRRRCLIPKRVFRQSPRMPIRFNQSRIYTHTTCKQYALDADNLNPFQPLMVFLGVSFRCKADIVKLLHNIIYKEKPLNWFHYI